VYCHPCDRFLSFLDDVHIARRRRLSAQSTRPAERTATMDPVTLTELLASLDPFVAGEVIDALARLGLLPEPPSPDEPIALWPVHDRADVRELVAA
jgi:hypothetical protein